MRLAFFDTKEYDRLSFDKINNGKYDITYFDVLLSSDTVILAKGFDAVCAFVNDKIDKDVLDKLNEYGIHVLVLRCAGYNNVDVRSAYKKVHILTVPGYAPVAIAEHAFALLLSLARHIHKAYNRVRDFNFSVLNMPGHTSDSICFYFYEDKVMFTGDFLFKGSIGRCDLGGSEQDMFKSLERIKEYDSNIKIYPGHGESTTLKKEFNSNIYLS